MFFTGYHYEYHADNLNTHRFDVVLRLFRHFFIFRHLRLLGAIETDDSMRINIDSLRKITIHNAVGTYINSCTYRKNQIVSTVSAI